MKAAILALALPFALIGTAAASQRDHSGPRVADEGFSGEKAATFNDAPLTQEERLASKGSAKPPPPEPPEVWESGIFNDPEVPASSSDVRIENRWQRDIDRKHYAVYAGSTGSAYRRTRGLVLWSLQSYDFEQQDRRIIEAKGVRGALRVEKELPGPVLRLRAEDGGAHYFDPVARRFVPRP